MLLITWQHVRNAWTLCGSFSGSSCRCSSNRKYVLNVNISTLTRVSPSMRFCSISTQDALVPTSKWLRISIQTCTLIPRNGTPTWVFPANLFLWRNSLQNNKPSRNVLNTLLRSMTRWLKSGRNRLHSLGWLTLPAAALSCRGSRYGRRQGVGGTSVTGFPRICLVAGLRHRKRDAAWEPTHEASAKPNWFELCLARRRKAEGQQWRIGKTQSAQGSPLV